MDRQFLPTTENPTILIDVAGDLRLKGITEDEPQVTAKGTPEEELTLEERDGQIWVSSTADCSLRVPRGSQVQVKAVHGDATLKGLEGMLSIELVHGNLTLRDVGETSIKHIYGDVVAKNIEGSLCFEDVDGNLQVKDVQGVFTVSGRVAGNIRLQDVDGGGNAKADGNITLRLDPGPGEKYEFTASGNIFCRLPEDASVEVSVPKAAQVMVNLPEARSSAPIKTPYSLSLGDADASLILHADGNVALDSHAPSWGEFGDLDFDIDIDMEGVDSLIGEQIGAHLDAQMANIEAQLEAQMAGLELRLNSFGLNPEQVRRAEERAREASQRAQEHAQERIRMAQQRMERKLASAQRKVEIKTRAAERAAQRGARRGRPPVQFSIPTPYPPNVPGRPSVPPVPPVEPISEQERLLILHMLEQNTISIEQAEKLLSALEGKE